MNREESKVEVSPRCDDRNNHGDVSIRGRDGVFQRESIAEVVVGQVCRGRVSLCLCSFVDMGTDKGQT